MGEEIPRMFHRICLVLARSGNRTQPWARSGRLQFVFSHRRPLSPPTGFGGTSRSLRPAVSVVGLRVWGLKSGFSKADFRMRS